MNKAMESRRGFLRGMTAIPVGIAAAGPVGTAVGAQWGCVAKTAGSTRSAYRPGFFTGPEWGFVCAAVVLLIPRDDLGPGALEAGVPERIDRQMLEPYGFGRLRYTSGPHSPDAPAELGFQMDLVPRHGGCRWRRAHLSVHAQHGRKHHGCRPEIQCGEPLPQSWDLSNVFVMGADVFPQNIADNQTFPRLAKSANGPRARDGVPDPDRPEGCMDAFDLDRADCLCHARVCLAADR